MQPGRPAAVADRFRGAEHLKAWLDELEHVGPPPRPLRLPSPDEAIRVLRHLGVPDEDVAEIVDELPSPERDPELWWLLERSYHRLTAGLGEDQDFQPSPDGRGPWGSWPELPTSFGVAGRLFYLHLYLAAVPAIRRWHLERGVDDAISWTTLENLGRNVRLYRADHGVTGLDAPWWLVLHFRGGLFQLGRLQFRRGTAAWTRADVKDATAPFGPGDRVLDVHIPPTGPLTPDLVDAALASAHAFFGRHFPAEDSPWGICASWMLDPQLADYLPEDSNIIRFQRRFHLVPEAKEEGDARGDAGIIWFVFRRVNPCLDDLPQDTTLQRAIVTHLRDGGHWRTRRGWCSL
jgi:hypothetical protein